MATRLTRNLRLRITDNLTADSISNLEKLDTLGSVYIIDNTGTVRIRSSSDIKLEPQSSDVGGSGTGGSITLGSSVQPLTALNIHADEVSLGPLAVDGAISILDTATGGTKYLDIKYKSDVSGSVDTVADRVLAIDMQGGSRELVLGGNLTISSGTVQLGSVDGASWVIPSNTGSTNKFLQNDGSGNLSWETASGSGTYLSGSATWSTGDGTTKTVTHGLGTRQLAVQVLDIDSNYDTIEVQVTRPTNNTIQLVASSAPSGAGWLIIYNQID